MGWLAGFDEKRRVDEELKNKLKEKKQSELLMEKNDARYLRAHLRLELNDLKRLVENGVLDEKLFDKIISDKKITENEMKEVLDYVKVTEILDKIEEIEKTKTIDKILPKKFRITKKEFLEAKKDPKKRGLVLKKVDKALDYLFYQNNQVDDSITQLFTSFAFMVDKKFVSVQENLIDIKDDLS